VASRQAEAEWVHGVLPRNAQGQVVFWPVQAYLAPGEAGPMLGLGTARCLPLPVPPPALPLCSSSAGLDTEQLCPVICFSKTTFNPLSSRDWGFQARLEALCQLNAMQKRACCTRSKAGLWAIEVHPSFQASAACLKARAICLRQQKEQIQASR